MNKNNLIFIVFLLTGLVWLVFSCNREGPENEVNKITGVSERVDATGRLHSDFVEIPYQPKGQKGASQLLDYRKPNSWEIIESIKIDNLKKVEHWFAGQLELKLYVIAAKEGVAVSINNSYGFFPIRKDVKKKKDWMVRCGLFEWTQEYGDYITYAWLEKDGLGALEAFEITVTWRDSIGREVALKFDPKKLRYDEDCGKVMINRGEPNFRNYGSNLSWLHKFENR